MGEKYEGTNYDRFKTFNDKVWELKMVAQNIPRSHIFVGEMTVYGEKLWLSKGYHVLISPQEGNKNLIYVLKTNMLPETYYLKDGRLVAGPPPPYSFRAKPRSDTYAADVPAIFKKRESWDNKWYATVRGRPYPLSSIHLYDKDGVKFMNSSGWLEMRDRINGQLGGIEFPKEIYALLKEPVYDRDIIFIIKDNTRDEAHYRLFIPVNRFQVERTKRETSEHAKGAYHTDYWEFTKVDDPNYKFQIVTHSEEESNVNEGLATAFHDFMKSIGAYERSGHWETTTGGAIDDMKKNHVVVIEKMHGLEMAIQAFMESLPEEPLVSYSCYCTNPSLPVAYETDTRSHEIKRILKKAYPDAKFSVTIDKYSMGESIHIHASNVRDIDFNRYQWLKDKVGGALNVFPTPEDKAELEWLTNESDKSTETMKNIKGLVEGYEHIRRDDQGEILSGGNTMLFVDAMDREPLKYPKVESPEEPLVSYEAVACQFSEGDRVRVKSVPSIGILDWRNRLIKLRNEKTVGTVIGVCAIGECVVTVRFPWDVAKDTTGTTGFLETSVSCLSLEEMEVESPEEPLVSYEAEDLKNRLRATHLLTKRQGSYLYRIHHWDAIDDIVKTGYLCGTTPRESTDKILLEHPEYRKEWSRQMIENPTWGVSSQTTNAPRLYFSKQEDTHYEGDVLLRVDKSVADRYGGQLQEDEGYPDEDFFYDGRVNIPSSFIEVKVGDKWLSFDSYIKLRKKLRKKYMRGKDSYNAVPASAFFVLYNKEPVTGVSLRLTDYADSIVEIDDIEAHKTGEGSGSKAMRRITKIADETGTILFLVPRGDSRVDVPEDDSDEWRGNIFHRLSKFYERFGFELSANGDTMYRYPHRH